MSKFENVPNINKQELQPTESKKMVNVNESEFKRKELDELKTEKELEEKAETKNPELTFEEKLKILENRIKTQQKEIERLTGSIEKKRTELNEVRKKLGLPPIEEDPPNTFSEKYKLEKLKSEQLDFEKQKKNL